MTAPASGFRAFVIVWSGQFLSLVGSQLTGFSLAVYVYRLTNSATTLGVVLVLSMLPSILASPVAGSLVDRWGSKRSLLVSNTGNVILTLILALLLFTDTFAVWHVYLVVATASTLAALEMPALAALTPQLVPKEQLDRANGMRMLAWAASQVLAPVAAGFLLLAIDIDGIVLLDLLSFSLAIVTLLIARIPKPGRRAAAETGETRSLLAEFRDGWRYVVARRGLLALLLFIGAVNFSAGVIELLLTPLVLNFASFDGLGTVLSIGGLGMIATSVAVSVWGGPRRRIRGILLFSLVLALATVIGSARPNVALIAAAAFLFMGALGVIISTNQSIWQTKVEPHLLGRVLALVSMVASVPQLLAYAVAGLAADRLFEPLVGRDDVRSPTLAMLIGHGSGRGVALLMMVMGVLIAITVCVAAMNQRLVRLEDDLPDATSDVDGHVAEPVSDAAGPPMSGEPVTVPSVDRPRAGSVN
jgi:MFS family permease